ncbi:MAG: hypothetical protein JSS27_06385 [Planctomycetes bacterium]|nr:hypothetical protein [Planctomycetota bacterium]
MLSLARGYFNALFDQMGQTWNRLWFTAVDPLPLGVLRVFTGLLATYALLTLTPDLDRLIGRQGMLPLDLARQMEGFRDADYGGAYRFSVLDYAADARSLRTIHYLSVAVVALYTLGVFSRVTSVLAAATMISYSHRMFVVVSPFEMMLNLLMLYICVGPSGAYLSFDAWWRDRSGRVPVKPSVSANIALNLIQVHLTLVFVMMVMAKMFGDAWWNGTAFWWLSLNSNGGVFDLTSLAAQTSPPLGRYLINLWTHAQIVYELTFPLAIWHPLTRPLWLVVGVVLWVLLALVSGLFTFGLAMIAATLAFVSADQWRMVCGKSS